MPFHAYAFVSGLRPAALQGLFRLGRSASPRLPAEVLLTVSLGAGAVAVPCWIALQVATGGPA